MKIEDIKELKYRDKVRILKSLISKPRFVVIHINNEEIERLKIEDNNLFNEVLLLDFTEYDNNYIFN